jgi:metallophosphoesterase superfamily enzyme
MPATLPLAPDLHLTGHRAAWIPSRGALGWLPPGETADAVAVRALAAADAVGARWLVVAGDVRHSTRDADEGEHEEVRVFLRAVAHRLRVTLVPGNHDRDAAIYGDTGVEVAGGDVAIGESRVMHAPPRAVPTEWTVCGHLHPVVDVRDATGVAVRYPCALVTEPVVVLPAFSAWAGGSPLHKLRGALHAAEWRAYPMSGGEVFGTA